MGEPAATPGSAIPPQQDERPQERRTCRSCNETKVVSPETWPYRNRGKNTPYQARGLRCLDCEKERKRNYEERRDKIAALVADVPPAPQRGQTGDKDKQREAVKQSRLDVAKALKAGSRVLNEYAASILARVLEWAEDPGHENHLWAVQFMAERIVPRKLYEELGGQAAGLGGLNDKRPQFIIQVLPAQPEAPEGRVIAGVATTVELLPAPE